MKDGDFYERVGPVTSDIRRLVSGERYIAGPVPLDIQNLPVFPVAFGVSRLLDGQFFNSILTLSGGSLKRDLPVPPPGLSPGQTARVYSLFLYLKSLEPPALDDPEEAKAVWHPSRNFRLQGTNPAISGGLVAALEQLRESYPRHPGPRVKVGPGPSAPEPPGEPGPDYQRW